METQEKEQFSISEWTKFTLIGWILGFVLIIVLAVVMDTLGLGNFQCFIGAGIGAGVGYMQWLVLRRRNIGSIKWFWFSTLGLTVPFLIYDLLHLFIDFELGNYLIPICAALGALISGQYQSQILMENSINANKWIISNFIAWALGAFLVFGTRFTNDLSAQVWIGFILNLLLILGGGVVLGLISGYFLKRILASN